MTILAGKLTEESSVLNITVLHNPLNAQIVSCEETGTGQYIVTIDKDILNENMPAKRYLSSNILTNYFVASISSNQFSVSCYDITGNQISGSLSNCEFQIETY